MGKKMKKLPRTGGNKSGKKTLIPDVAVHTSLPPQVDGHLRSYLILKVTKVTWFRKQHEGLCVVFVKWWGEDGEQSKFIPVDANVPESKAACLTTARYAVRSGPSQFAAYLSDMGSLYLEVVTPTNHLSKLGSVTLSIIGQLTHRSSIQGWFPIVSSSGKGDLTVGELEIGVSLEPLAPNAGDHAADPAVSESGSSLNLESRESSKQNASSSRLPLAELNIATQNNAEDSEVVRSRSDSRFERAKEDFDPFDSTKIVEDIERPERVLIADLHHRSRVLKNALNNYNQSAIEHARPETMGDSSVRPNHSHPTNYSDLYAGGNTESRFVDLVMANDGRMDNDDIENLQMALGHTALSLSSNEGDYSGVTDSAVEESIIKEMFFNDPSSGWRDHQSDVSLDFETERSQMFEQKKRKVVQVKKLTCGCAKSDCQCTTSSSSGAPTFGGPEKMSPARLTLLGRISMFRLMIDKAILNMKGKQKYHIELSFPVIADLNLESGHAMSAEVISIPSQGQDDTATFFNYQGTFPVKFNGDILESWWNSSLILRLFYLSPPNRVLLGSGSLSLKHLLTSDNMSLTVQVLIKSNRELDGENIIGKVYGKLELFGEGDAYDIAMVKFKADQSSSLEQSFKTVSPILIKKQREAPAPTPIVQANSVPAQQRLKTSGWQESQRFLPFSSATTSTSVQSFVYIPYGIDITNNGVEVSQASADNLMPSNHADTGSRNPYLLCRLFSSSADKQATSRVCWGSSQPKFDFHHVKPVNLNDEFVKSMNNNFMVIEVWDKSSSASEDRLIGLVKISLHQFYLSFREQSVANALLKAKYPVVAADSYHPIINPFNGLQFGYLKVLLAMGTNLQIDTLKTMKLQQLTADAQLSPIENPHKNLLNNAFHYSHQFSFYFENITRLTLPDGVAYGETDCFIKYYFPNESSQSYEITLDSYITPAVLCSNEPTLDYHTKHTVNLSGGMSLEHILKEGTSSLKNRFQFELWVRQYSPSLKDRLIGKGWMTFEELSSITKEEKRNKLTKCAIMLKRVQNENRKEDETCGILNIGVSYNYSQLSVEPNTEEQNQIRELETHEKVCLSVVIHRACGLKTLAKVISFQTRNLVAAAQIGTNVFAKFRPSFFPEREAKITKTFARTFTPNFSHHAEFLCPLVFQHGTSKPTTLADILQTSEVVIELWHQPDTAQLEERHVQNSENSGSLIFIRTGDIFLGRVNISLSQLLMHRTGIRGWFPAKLPEGMSLSTSSSFNKLTNVGGLVEVSVFFPEPQIEREKILKSARSNGFDTRLLSYPMEEFWEQGTTVYITINLLAISLPLKFEGLENSWNNLSVMLRFSFFNEATVFSPPFKMNVSEAYETVYAKPNYIKTFELTSSQSLLWYLREECLEIHVLVSMVSNSNTNSDGEESNSGRIIGAIQVRLDELLVSTPNVHGTTEIANEYPVYQQDVAALEGSAILVNMKLEREETPTKDKSHAVSNPLSLATVPQIENVNILPVSLKTSSTAPSFSANIGIEQAAHLPDIIIDKKKGSKCVPNAYVSFISFDSSEPITTAVVYNSDSPKWNFVTATNLSSELLDSSEKKFLILKVWHKSRGPDAKLLPDRCLGFAAIDLTPLTSNLLLIQGWYHIVDLSGRCQGQIKINIMPLEDLIKFRSGIPYEDGDQLRKGALNQEAIYQTTSLYAGFPGHISRFTEQRVRLQNNEDIQSRQQETIAAEIPVRDTGTTARDVVAKAMLQKSMGELDEITRNLKKRLEVKTNQIMKKKVNTNSNGLFSSNENNSNLPETNDVLSTPQKGPLGIWQKAESESEDDDDDKESISTTDDEGDSPYSPKSRLVDYSNSDYPLNTNNNNDYAVDRSESFNINCERLSENYDDNHFDRQNVSEIWEELDEDNIENETICTVLNGSENEQSDDEMRGDTPSFTAGNKMQGTNVNAVINDDSDLGKKQYTPAFQENLFVKLDEVDAIDEVEVIESAVIPEDLPFCLLEGDSENLNEEDEKHVEELVERMSNWSSDFCLKLPELQDLGDETLAEIPTTAKFSQMSESDSPQSVQSERPRPQWIKINETRSKVTRPKSAPSITVGERLLKTFQAVNQPSKEEAQRIADIFDMKP